jgi:hypothetical protein
VPATFRGRSLGLPLFYCAHSLAVFRSRSYLTLAYAKQSEVGNDIRMVDEIERARAASNVPVAGFARQTKTWRLHLMLPDKSRIPSLSLAFGPRRPSSILRTFFSSLCLEYLCILHDFRRAGTHRDARPQLTAAQSTMATEMNKRRTTYSKSIGTSWAQVGKLSGS